MVTNRMEKIDELVKNEISSILRVTFPDEFISVTQVHVSKDLSFAKVWVSSIKDIDETVKRCKKINKQVKDELAHKIELRKVPNLYFVPDKTEIEASKIEKLIKESKE